VSSWEQQGAKSLLHMGHSTMTLSREESANLGQNSNFRSVAMDEVAMFVRVFCCGWFHKLKHLLKGNLCNKNTVFSWPMCTQEVVPMRKTSFTTANIGVFTNLQNFMAAIWTEPRQPQASPPKAEK